MKLNEIHNCKKCQGKIVCISIDKLGVTRCNYCDRVVNYEPYFIERLKEIKNVIQKRT